MTNNIKAIALVSGGLDSLLAVKLIESQGIFVQGLFFETPFFSSRKAVSTCSKNSIPLQVVPVFDDYMKILLNPSSGYGKFMNPCIDCHAFMLRKAYEYLKQNAFDFIITGEVLGERPMSQNRNSLLKVAKLSGCPELVMRPLSAKLLAPTRPELEGLVDRNRLESIEGRVRKRQYALAEEFHISEIPQPGGGCLLTDEGSAKRLKLLLEIKKDFSQRYAELLKAGRYVKLEDGNILIVGRNERENELLKKIYRKESDILFEPLSHPGPSALITDAGNFSAYDFAASVCARYSDVPEGEKLIMEASAGEKRWEISAAPCSNETIKERLFT
jgi:tRNA-uridine 2-sulfurtransferase